MTTAKRLLAACAVAIGLSLLMLAPVVRAAAGGDTDAEMIAVRALGLDSTRAGHQIAFQVLAEENLKTFISGRCNNGDCLVVPAGQQENLDNAERWLQKLPARVRQQILRDAAEKAISTGNPQAAVAIYQVAGDEVRVRRAKILVEAKSLGLSPDTDPDKVALAAADYWLETFYAGRVQKRGQNWACCSPEAGNLTSLGTAEYWLEYLDPDQQAELVRKNAQVAFEWGRVELAQELCGLIGEGDPPNCT